METLPQTPQLADESHQQNDQFMDGDIAMAETIKQLQAERDELLGALKLVLMTIRVGSPEYDLTDIEQIASEIVSKLEGMNK